MTGFSWCFRLEDVAYLLDGLADFGVDRHGLRRGAGYSMVMWAFGDEVGER